MLIASTAQALPAHKARAGVVSVLCNEASLSSEAENSDGIGAPTETVLLIVAEGYVLGVARERARHPKLDEHPFDAATKRMTTLHGTHDDGMHLVALKGAPAVVLSACSAYADGANAERPLNDEMRARFLAENEEMAEKKLSHRRYSSFRGRP